MSSASLSRSILSYCDELFSLKIRHRHGWQCQRCGAKFARLAQNLHCSHFWSRSNKATRYDEDNCDALCADCHAIWEDDKNGAYRAFKISQLGQERFDALKRRARSCIKFGAWELEQMLRELMEEMQRMKV
jgi:5-methylcytosine-specific restriction endonuclease McrA